MSESAETIRFDGSSAVLVVGAHPDDAARACGGVLLRCLGAGARLTVVAVTDGAALHGKEGIPTARRTARDRKAEQVKALAALGVPMSRVLFLGFPDGGIPKLRHVHRTSRVKPYFDPWLDADRADADSFAPARPFTGESLLELLSEIIAPLSPTHVFTHESRDKHPDHRGVTHFVRKALARPVGGGAPRAAAAVYEYLTYIAGMKWPPPGSEIRLESAKALPFPERVIDFRLSPGETARKDSALDCFVPILGAGYIDNWRRTNEIYWRTDET